MSGVTDPGIIQLLRNDLLCALSVCTVWSIAVGSLLLEHFFYRPRLHFLCTLCTLLLSCIEIIFINSSILLLLDTIGAVPLTHQSPAHTV